MIEDSSIGQRFVSKAKSVDWSLSVRELLQYRFVYEHERFLVNDRHNLEHVFVVKLPYIRQDFRWMKRSHSLEIGSNGIFQNNVTKSTNENPFLMSHQRKRKIELILKNQADYSQSTIEVHT